MFARIHATVLSRLLGDQLAPRSRPSRDISQLLAGLVDDGGLPDGAAQCGRISKAVRESVGETFFSPPARPAVSSMSSAHRASTATRRHQAQAESLFDNGSEVDVTEPGGSQVHCTTSTDGDRHRLVLEELTAFPDVLEKYLAARARSSGTTGFDVEEPRLLPSRLGDDDDWHAIEPKPKRQRCTSVETGGEELLHHQSKKSSDQQPCSDRYTASPTPPRTPGTSPHEFVRGILAHNAVTFAPHPATLNRLYDFAFGVHGLSIMHLHNLESLARVSWVLASKEKGTKINMQNFSVNVELPTVAAPASLAQIQAVLDSMKTYCDAFGSLSTCRVVQALRKVIQETAGLGFWETTDLKYLVYWIDTLQQFNQLVAAKKVQLLLHGSERSFHGSRGSDGGWSSRSKYGNVSRGSRGAGSGLDQQHRPPPFSSAQHSKVPPHIRALIPRGNGRAICMKFLSVAGCPGDAANPDECVFFNSRCHVVPASPIPGSLADYIATEFKGLRKGVRRD
ncbi:unnamed protein product [Phytophthora fragariaefolia]|uniref:Unnamed protein product n=1 Tax=Phytophthora fragariaefolia TaxID=1490495 RepID=A0A9W6Y9L8_9STRA|nr:unnamed protein product [Phytophthora fragariaefolia]